MRWLSLALIAISCFLAFANADIAAADCGGDCDGDRTVTIAEVIRCVGAALGNQARSECSRCDGDADGEVAINELIVVVRNALKVGGCAQGTSCTSEANCSSGNCVDSVCCLVDGCPPGQSCALGTGVCAIDPEDSPTPSASATPVRSATAMTPTHTRTRTHTATTTPTRAPTLVPPNECSCPMNQFPCNDQASCGSTRSCQCCLVSIADVLTSAQICVSNQLSCIPGPIPCGETPEEFDARVRRTQADAELGGVINYYRQFSDAVSVEAVRRWDAGVRACNLSEFERTTRCGGTWLVVYRETCEIIDGADVKLTTDPDCGVF